MVTIQEAIQQSKQSYDREVKGRSCRRVGGSTHPLVTVVFSDRTQASSPGRESHTLHCSVKEEPSVSLSTGAFSQEAASKKRRLPLALATKKTGNASLAEGVKALSRQQVTTVAEQESTPQPVLFLSGQQAESAEKHGIRHPQPASSSPTKPLGSYSASNHGPEVNVQSVREGAEASTPSRMINLSAMTSEEKKRQDAVACLLCPKYIYVWIG